MVKRDSESLNVSRNNLMVNRKTIRMVIDAASAERKFMRMAISLSGTTIMNSLPIKRKSGFPGGCGLPRMLAEARNSPQSQNDMVGAIVSM